VSPAVYSMRKGSDPIPPDAVYVGRPTQFGNPFSVKSGTGDKHGAHAAVVARYREWIASDEATVIRQRAVRDLAGRDLVCWCQSPSDENPLPCHATVLLEIANPPRRKGTPS
jgi:hypothetical protein